MDIENMRLFVEVARRGNFATVARDRDIDPSSVSRAIVLLEDTLGVRLLQRSTRRVALTEAGEIYLSRIVPLLDDLDRARDAARGVSTGPSGSLRMTASVAFGTTCLIPLLPAFRQQYPDVKLELQLTDTILDLVAERIDLALRLGRQVDANFIAVKLFDTRYRVCASPAYLKDKQAPQAPADLQQHRCLLIALPEFRSRWLFRDPRGTVTEIPVHGDITILNALALRACALAGMGPVLLANWLIDADIAEGRLVDLFPEYRVSVADFDTAAWLLYPSRAHLPNKVRVMIDFLKQHLN
ncbi:MAG: LysR family transcriptional regulator [Gammaproteobacteria bacterium]|nr:LysR family transcriptional regulator [Gammaproteobacteria bacterium]